jgi:hypothetical protein
MDAESMIKFWKNPEDRRAAKNAAKHPSGLVEVDPLTAAEIGGGGALAIAGLIGGAIYATVQGTVCNGTCAIPNTYGCCNG